MTAVSTLQIPLQSNNIGDAEALGLKRWMGEVAGAYFQSSVTEGLFPHKSISGGLTEAQWILGGRRGDEYFARGDDLLEDSADGDYVKAMPTAERVIRVDRPLTASSFLDRQDSVLTHFDAQGEMRRQSGQTLARTIDKHRLICVLRGAHRTDGGSGNEDTFIDGLKPDISSDSPTTLAAATFAGGASESPTGTLAQIALMAERFDDLEVPEDGRYMFVDPKRYHYILNNLADETINVDYRGIGSRARADVRMINGFMIVKTTNMPASDIATNPTNLSGGTSGNDYRVKGANLGALFATRDSLAEVRLGGGFTIESGYLINRKGTLVSVDWTGGIGELRPEACGAIYTVASVPTTANYS